MIVFLNLPFEYSRVYFGRLSLHTDFGGHFGVLSRLFVCEFKGLLWTLLRKNKLSLEAHPIWISIHRSDRNVRSTP
jgi:hypothetical protein